jgi:hypothetical protein
MDPNTTRCEEVIITDLARRGKGVKHSPIRAIVQVYTKQGELIAEYDPSPETFTVMDLVNFTRWWWNARYKNSPAIVDQKVSEDEVFQWLDSIEKQ